MNMKLLALGGLALAVLKHALALDPGTSFLSDNALLRKGQIQNVLEHRPATKQPTCNHPTGPIETTMCDYETIESVNNDLFHTLHELVQQPFFRYFQLDLYRECPFWDENSSCMNRECAITSVDESEVPERWRAATLSKIDLPPVSQRHELLGCYYKDSDFCFLEDLTEGEYFDLALTVERFTGYSGISANNVWRAIYEENCFGLSELNLLADSSKSNVPAPVTLPDTMIDPFGPDGNQEQCLEKRVYYKVISGMHASISTHLCYEWFNHTSGEWGPNLPCFIDRVASHPERLQYIYFNTVLLLRAVARLGPYLSAYDYCSTGTHEDDAETLRQLSKVIGIATEVGQFDESVLFRGENANVLKEEFKTHFRNVSRIMDCVGCDRCRLWGKVQTTGLAVVMKVLFELDERALDPRTNSNLLQRSEVVALINTLHRFSESLDAVNVFRKLWAEMQDEGEREKLVQGGERAASSPSGKTPHQPSALEKDVPESSNLTSPFGSLVDTCMQGTRLCVDVVLRVWQKAEETFKSIYRPGKSQGLFEEF